MKLFPSTADAIKLFQKSADVILLERRDVVETELRSLTASFAAKGIVGGPMANTFSMVGQREVQERATLLVAAMIRASDSEGIGYESSTSETLKNALRGQLARQADIIASQVSHTAKILPNPTATEQSMRNAIAQARMVATSFSANEIDHFVTSLTTKRRMAGRGVLDKLFWILLGAIPSGVISWILHR